MHCYSMSSPQVLIVLTASPWQDQQSLNWLKSVEKARNWGIEIYSAGFGPSVKLPQLASIVHNPARDAYIISSYDDPDQMTRTLVNEIGRGELTLFLLPLYSYIFFSVVHHKVNIQSLWGKGRKLASNEALKS